MSKELLTARASTESGWPHGSGRGSACSPVPPQAGLGGGFVPERAVGAAPDGQSAAASGLLPAVCGWTPASASAQQLPWSEAESQSRSDLRLPCSRPRNPSPSRRRPGTDPGRAACPPRRAPGTVRLSVGNWRRRPGRRASGLRRRSPGLPWRCSAGSGRRAPGPPPSPFCTLGHPAGGHGGGQKSLRVLFHTV